jgi:hypothetical protein
MGVCEAYWGSQNRGYGYGCGVRLRAYGLRPAFPAQVRNHPRSHKPVYRTESSGQRRALKLAALSLQQSLGPSPGPAQLVAVFNANVLLLGPFGGVDV